MVSPEARAPRGTWIVAQKASPPRWGRGWSGGADTVGDERVAFDASRVLHPRVGAFTPNPALPPSRGKGSTSRRMHLRHLHGPSIRIHASGRVTQAQRCGSRADTLGSGSGVSAKQPPAKPV